MPHFRRFLFFLLLMAPGLLPVLTGAAGTPADTSSAESSSEGTSSAGISGTVLYEASPELPWRYARYYVNRKGQLAEAVVVLTRRSGGRIRTSPAPEHESVTHEMGQKDFRFDPETLVIREGDRVRFTNADQQLHNVQTSDLLPFNVNTPPEGKGHVQLFPKAGGTRRPVRLGCVFHSNMRAWIYVFDHPYCALTGPDGSFHLKHVPPGEYRLTVVHPAGQLSHSTDVTVEDGAVTRSTLTLTPDDLTNRKGKS
ncbi:MAG: hypothetical protein KDA79_05965 [Planctomycetaceae bacterium]|nr:hypothetical protein [Planctomycetaceae bacterium]